MDIAALYQSIQPCYPELKGQVAIITGSARGIGKGIALRLAREGMRVVVHGHIQAETDATAAQLAGLGAEVLAITANFRQEAEIYRVFDETMQAYGTVNLLVNNAAELSRGHFFEVGLPLLEGEINVNIKAPYLCSYRAAEIMRARRGRQHPQHQLSRWPARPLERLALRHDQGRPGRHDACHGPGTIPV